MKPIFSDNLLKKFIDKLKSSESVVRPAWIEFEYYDENGRLRHWRTKDTSKRGKILNRVFQHEIDHMNGIINVDLVKDSRDLILESDPGFYKHAEFEEI